MDVPAAVALSLVEGVTRSRVSACLKAVTAERPADGSDQLARAVQARLAIGPDQMAAALERTPAALADARRAGFEPVVWQDPRYPPLVAEIHDPPPVLWVRGRSEALTAPAVALVGARAATTQALETARSLAAGLARRGVVVVSGLARGVDSAAHRGALEVDGATVGVLGSGGDRLYPPEHAGLAAEMARRGAVVTELAPGVGPLPEHFPLRNRIISGLARALVVVEAAERSGSLITARLALEQGREVMAVPGSTLGGRNRGAHALIRDGAKLVETPDDILEELLGFMPVDEGSGDGCNVLLEDELTLAMRQGEPCSVDELSARTGLAPGPLLARLLELELAGRVARVGGGRFVLAGRRW